MAWFKLSSHPFKHCTWEDWFSLIFVFFWSVLQNSGRRRFPKGVIIIGLLLYSNEFFLVTSGRCCSIKLSFISINIAKKYPSYLFLFLPRTSQYCELLKKSIYYSSISRLKLLGNYCFDSFHQCHSRTFYTWGTWFEKKVVFFCSCHQNSYSPIFSKLLLISIYLGVISSIWPYLLAQCLSLRSLSKNPHIQQTIPMDNFLSDRWINLLVIQYFKNCLWGRFFSIFKFNVNLSFRLEFIHLTPQPKTWTCVRWFSWGILSIDCRIKFPVVRKSLQMFCCHFIWTLFIIFLRSYRVYSF